MRILLIKPKQIGDSLILTPTIMAIKNAYPESEIWVVVRRGCEGILAGCPEVARILTVAPVEKRDRRTSDLWMGLKTILRIFISKFDYAFELGDGGRGRNLLLVAHARSKNCFSVKPTDAQSTQSLEKRRIPISRFDWQTCHRVEKDYFSVSEFLPLPGEIPPLRFARERTQPWGPGKELRDFAVVQVGTRQGFNRWHREGWKQVVAHLLERFSNIVISCGPIEHEIEKARWLQNELGSRVLSTEGKASWAQVAWLFHGAKLYVGPNTAAMHLAAACGCPVVTLFGPSIEDHWHPWRVPYRIVTTPGYVPPVDARERYAAVKKRAMEDIRPEDVIAACDGLLQETNKASGD